MNLLARGTASGPRAARLLFAVLLAAPFSGDRRAEAAFPGENGKIAFSRSVAGFFQVFTVDPDGSGETQLTFGSTHAVGPSWSPDGLQLAFCRNLGIEVANADGTNARQVATAASCVVGHSTAWSPDGRQIAFRSVVGGQPGLSVTNVDGSGAIPILSGIVVDTASWSPDGTTIAFGGTRDGERRGIYLVNPDGSGLTRITPADSLQALAPDWSPDGNKIVFAMTPPGAFTTDIFIMNADGSSPVPVTATPDVSENVPAWSPDGMRIAFSRLGGIYVIDGAGEVQITTGVRPGVAADWRRPNGLRGPGIDARRQRQIGEYEEAVRLHDHHRK